MPTGPGGLDANGIWQYGEDDTEALASDLLNLGMASVSTEVEAINTAIESAGGLVSVKHALFTGTQSASVAGSGSVAVTDLSITHAMSNASNKLIITAFLGIVASSSGRADVGLLVRDGGNDIGEGDTAGSRKRLIAGGKYASQSNFQINNLSASFVYEPGSTASKTYTVRAATIQAATYTLYINRGEVDSDNAGNGRASSGLIIQEVSV